LSLASLAEALRKEFTTLGLPTVLEMAIVSSSGRVVFSDLSKAAMERVSPLYNNLLLMGQGDSLSLALDSTRTIIASRVSNRAILITLTDKKMGIVLAKLEGVRDKFGRLLDEFIASEEAKAPVAPPTAEVTVENTTPTQLSPLVEEVQPSLVPPPPAQPEEIEKKVTAPVEVPPAVVAAPPISAFAAIAKTLIDEARKKGIVFRAFGGAAVAIHCPSAEHPPLAREYPDIDVIGHADQDKDIRKFLEETGYEPVKKFNALHGRKRLKFVDPKINVGLDVFFDVFEMCHRFDFKDRLDLDQYTLSLADLLMTKLQIIELVGKDVLDIMAILLDHEYGRSDPEKINTDYIAGLCSDDWGLWKTFTMNIGKVAELVDDYSLAEKDKKKIKSQLASFLKILEDEPKTAKWQKRAKVGEKSKWYEEV
jgi:hypothetical protein